MSINNNFLLEILQNVFSMDELVEQCDVLDTMSSMSDKYSDSYKELEKIKNKFMEKYNSKIKDQKDSITKLSTSVDKLDIKSENISFLMKKYIDFDQKLDKNKQFLSYEGIYSKVGSQNIMNQWRDIGSFMPNIGSIESLVEFYFNIMYSYHSRLIDPKKKDEGWFCRLPKEWGELLDAANISKEKKENLKKYGISLKNKNIGEFVDFKYYKPSANYSHDEYKINYKKSLNKFFNNGGSLLHVDMDTPIETKTNITLQPKNNNFSDIKYVTENLFNNEENMKRILPVGSAFFNSVDIGKCYYPKETISQTFKIIPPRGKCSIDPGRIDENIDISLTGINSVESNGPSKRTNFKITCNRFRTLFDIIMGSPYGGAEYLFDNKDANDKPSIDNVANTKEIYPLSGDIDYESLFKNREVTSGSGYLQSSKYNTITQDLRGKLYKKFIDKNNHETSIRKVDDLFNCTLKTTMNLEYIFCNCLNPLSNQNNPTRLSSLDQLNDQREERLRKLNICNGIKNFTGVSNMALEVKSTQDSNNINYYKNALISSSLRNEFLKNMLLFTWKLDDNRLPDSITQSKLFSPLFRNNTTKFNYQLEESDNFFDSNINPIVYNNYRLEDYSSDSIGNSNSDEIKKCREYIASLYRRSSRLQLSPIYDSSNDYGRYRDSRYRDSRYRDSRYRDSRYNNSRYRRSIYPQNSNDDINHNKLPIISTKIKNDDKKNNNILYKLALKDSIISKWDYTVDSILNSNQGYLKKYEKYKKSKKSVNTTKSKKSVNTTKSKKHILKKEYGKIITDCMLNIENIFEFKSTELKNNFNSMYDNILSEYGKGVKENLNRANKNLNASMKARFMFRYLLYSDYINNNNTFSKEVMHIMNVMNEKDIESIIQKLNLNSDNIKELFIILILFAGNLKIDEKTYLYIVLKLLSKSSITEEENLKEIIIYSQLIFNNIRFKTQFGNNLWVTIDSSKTLGVFSMSNKIKNIDLAIKNDKKKTKNNKTVKQFSSFIEYAIKNKKKTVEDLDKKVMPNEHGFPKLLSTSIIISYITDYEYSQWSLKASEYIVLKSNIKDKIEIRYFYFLWVLKEMNEYEFYNFLTPNLKEFTYNDNSDFERRVKECFILKDTDIDLSKYNKYIKTLEIKKESIEKRKREQELEKITIEEEKKKNTRNRKKKKRTKIKRH